MKTRVKWMRHVIRAVRRAYANKLEAYAMARRWINLNVKEPGLRTWLHIYNENLEEV